MLAVMMRLTGLGTLLAATAAVAIAACSGNAGSTTDAGVGPGGMDAHTGTSTTVEVGTGEDMFVPLTTDEMVELTRGPQGGGRTMGHHVWSGVRTTGFQPMGIRL